MPPIRNLPTIGYVCFSLACKRLPTIPHFILGLVLSSLSKAGFAWLFWRSGLIPKLIAGWGLFAFLFVASAIVARDFIPIYGPHCRHRFVHGFQPDRAGCDWVISGDQGCSVSARLAILPQSKIGHRHDLADHLWIIFYLSIQNQHRQTMHQRPGVKRGCSAIFLRKVIRHHRGNTSL